MAPEQARGDVENLDARSDIFSLGAILEFLLAVRSSQNQTATDPNGPHSARAARPTSVKTPVPQALAAIARKAMAPNPASRYSSASELAQDVARYLDGLPVSAYPEHIFRRIARWAYRYRIGVVLVLTYLLVRAVLIFLFRR
jgi:serine/threonine protein kinase